MSEQEVMIANLLLASILSTKEELQSYFEQLFLRLNKVSSLNNFVILQKRVFWQKNEDFAL